MNNRDVALLVVVGMMLVAGCADVTSTTDVTADGELDRVEVEAEISSLAYLSLESEAEDAGYDSVEEMIEAEAIEGIGENNVDSVTASTTSTDDGYRISVTADSVDPDGLGDVTVTVDDETVYYESTDVFNRNFGDLGIEFGTEYDGANDDLFGGFEGDDEDFEDVDEAFEEYEEDIFIEYSVTMPGEIQDTNAHEVSDDGTTATWAFTAEEADTVYAESAIDDDAATGDDGTDGSDRTIGGGSSGADDGTADDGTAPDDSTDGNGGDGADDAGDDTSNGDETGGSGDASDEDATDAADDVSGFGISAAAVAILAGLGLAFHRR